jgi:hypothetical protein
MTYSCHTKMQISLLFRPQVSFVALVSSCNGRRHKSNWCEFEMETSLESSLMPKQPRFMRLLERADILSELDDLLVSLGQGRGHVAAISGEAGIGKTSVIRAFIQSTSEQHLVLQSGCEDLMAPRPWGPLFDIADLLDPNLVEMLVDQQAQGRILNHLLVAIQRSRRPVIIIIEDVHWADDATLDLVKFLGRRAAALPLLLLVSHRDDEPGSKYSIGRILGSIAPQDLRRISLNPLTPAAVGELAEAAGRSVRDIHAVTNGNPFFVTEILASRPEATIPGSVRDAVWARFERCTIEQRIALEALSIIPGGANLGLLTALVTPQGCLTWTDRTSSFAMNWRANRCCNSCPKVESEVCTVQRPNGWVNRRMLTIFLFWQSAFTMQMLLASARP